MQGERLAPLVLLGAALLATVTLPRTWPRDQTIHYVLGDRAGHVERVDARWAAQTDPGDSLREVSFRYAPGTAPRVVTHEPRLSNGDYTVDVDVVADGQPTRYVRRVMLGGGVTSIDLTAGGASQ
ncbi:MAG TPA: hypothetical protein VK841_00880 [Polyangiaceae bacterium]|jgi:hypothetical protein|nr:hypothetical protein [Polyangiaceae bacterium]